MLEGSETYNERLFKSGIRKWLHTSRFRFVSNTVKKLEMKSLRVVELGCFDGRSLDFLPTSAIEKYQGFDADWEGGLTEARERNWPSNVEFSQCTTASDFEPCSDFNLFLSLETIEHIDDNEILEQYLRKVEELVARDGVLLITVPNEIGPVFLIKYMVKRILHGEGYRYTKKELFWQTLGVTSRVVRNEHKGFSYRELHSLLSEYFHVESSQGLPFKSLPKLLNFSVSFVCKPELRER